MATVVQIRDAIDSWVATNQGKLVAAQNAYYASHGHYFQGIATPNALPDDGVTIAADYTKAPTDQPHRWMDVFQLANVLPANIPAQVRIDVYDGPSGKGWSATLRATKAGVIYTKTWSVGPENRASDWAIEVQL